MLHPRTHEAWLGDLVFAVQITGRIRGTHSGCYEPPAFKVKIPLVVKGAWMHVARGGEGAWALRRTPRSQQHPLQNQRPGILAQRLTASSNAVPAATQVHVPFGVFRFRAADALLPNLVQAPGAYPHTVVRRQRAVLPQASQMVRVRAPRCAHPQPFTKTKSHANCSAGRAIGSKGKEQTPQTTSDITMNVKYSQCGDCTSSKEVYPFQPWAGLVPAEAVGRIHAFGAEW